MATFKDLTGEKFERLTVVRLSQKEKSGKRFRYYWLCKCECGNMHEVRTDSLTSGRVKSCGCLHKEQAIINVSKNHSHKKSYTTIYSRWQKIKDRCLNQNAPCYERYGGRGITLYNEWINDFQSFYEYVSNLERFEEEGYTLDRIDNNKGYEPNNLRWADNITQCRNRRSNIIVEYKKEKMTLIEASEKSGISYCCLNARLSRGVTNEKLFKPVKEKGQKRLVKYKDRLITLRELSVETGINYNTLKSRYLQGKRDQDLYKTC